MERGDRNTCARRWPSWRTCCDGAPARRAGFGGRRCPARPSHRRGRRGVGRSGVQHIDDRLPRDVDRPLLRRADPGAHVSADRQLRAGTPDRRERAGAGARPGGARRLPSAQPSSRRRHAARVPPGRRHPRPGGGRHARAHAPAAEAGRDARADRRARGDRARARAPGGPARLRQPGLHGVGSAAAAYDWERGRSMWDRREAVTASSCWTKA